MENPVWQVSSQGQLRKNGIIIVRVELPVYIFDLHNRFSDLSANFMVKN